MSVKITNLEIENTKRVRAVSLAPSETGLTVIGGKNNQGKTSVLDAIAWALGGDRFRPSSATRDGSAIPPHLKVTLSNGIVVERKGKNSDLKVTDPTGRRVGQTLLDSFVESFALNLPKFMAASDREKAGTLLRIIGVGDQLAALERQEAEAYNERRYVGQQYQKRKLYADGLPTVAGVPDEPISAAKLIQQQQEILARNGENQRKRAMLAQLENEAEQLTGAMEQLQAQLTSVEHDLEIARKDAAQLIDESTQELEQNIRNIEEINQKVQVNQEKRKAEAEYQKLGNRYAELTAEVEKARSAKTALLDSADLPLPGLSVADGALLYQGQRWDNMSGSDQLKVATAIVRKLNPQCGFVLMDKLEQMDTDTLADFSSWLEQEGLQVIATRVSTGDECSIIIEDGMVKEPSAAPQKTTWKAGTF